MPFQIITVSKLKSVGPGLAKRQDKTSKGQVGDEPSSMFSLEGGEGSTDHNGEGPITLANAYTPFLGQSKTADENRNSAR